MELMTCQKCKRLFFYIRGEYLCKECKEKEDVMFERTNQYIAEHERVRMQQVSEECDIPVKQIKKWIKEERIHTVDEQEVYSVCEGCGKPIPSGQFCTLCKSQYMKDIKSALEADKRNSISRKPVKGSGVQMRFLDHGRRR